MAKGMSGVTRHKWTPKEIRFLEKNIVGRSYAEMTNLFNRRFKTHFETEQVRSCCKYRKIYNGRTRKIVTPAQKKWLRENVPGKSFIIITDLFNSRFDTDFTPLQIRGFCNKQVIMAGKRFYRELPVGAERVWKSRKKVFVKMPDGSWLLKHYAVWEKAHGKIPTGHKVIFLDRNTSNFVLKNLELVTNSEVIHLQNSGFWCNDREVSRTALVIVRHNLAIHRRLEKEMGAEEHKRFRLRLYKEMKKRRLVLDYEEGIKQ
jgi:hypothetical protein